MNRNPEDFHCPDFDIRICTRAVLSELAKRKEDNKKCITMDQFEAHIKEKFKNARRWNGDDQSSQKRLIDTIMSVAGLIYFLKGEL